jgi:hypothetical protein
LASGAGPIVLWIYDIPSLLAIVLFGAGFVVIFWLGILILHPFIRKPLPQQPGLNATLTMYLQYLGIIYGLLLGLLAIGAYKITPRRGGRSSPRQRRSPRFIATSQSTPSHAAPISGSWCVVRSAP